MIFVLIAAAIIAALLGKFVDATAIAIILILNAVLGTVHEYRAEKAIDALRKMVVHTTRNMIFTGTIVTSGRGKAAVTATGSMIEAK